MKLLWSNLSLRGLYTDTDDDDNDTDDDTNTDDDDNDNDTRWTEHDCIGSLPNEPKTGQNSLTFPVFWVKFPNFYSLFKIPRLFLDWKMFSHFSSRCGNHEIAGQSMKDTE